MSNSDWNTRVASMRGATPFHHLEWGELARAYGHEVFFEREGNSYASFAYIKSALFGKRLIGIPYADYGAPIGQSSEELSLLLKKIIHQAKERHASVELRGIVAEQRSVYEKEGFEVDESQVTFQIPLDVSEEDLLARMKKSTRTEIHKIDREQPFVIKEHNDLEGFYSLYVATMRRHGSPAHSKKIFEIVIKTGLGRLWGAYDKERLVASFIVLPGHASVHHWISVVADDYRTRDAQTALLWACIRWAHKEKFSFFDMGRTRRATSVWRAKQSWGGEEVPLLVARWGVSGHGPDPSRFPYSLFSRIWRLLPSMITRRIGPLLAGSIGL